MTAREVSVVIKAALWRERRAAKFGHINSWQTAAFMRYKRLPKLSTLLKRQYPEDVRPPQEPNEVWSQLKAIAADNGFKITRHEKPIPRPVFH